MSQGNLITFDNKQMDINSCQVRRSRCGITECMVAGDLCEWRLSCGHLKFCIHPTHSGSRLLPAKRQRRHGNND